MYTVYITKTVINVNHKWMALYKTPQQFHERLQQFL